MKRAIGDSIKLEMKGKTPRYDCDLFLGPTSLRGGGFGVFAGKNYTKGQVVVRTVRIIKSMSDCHHQTIHMVASN